MNHSKTYVSTLTAPARTPVFEGEKRLFGCDFYPLFSDCDSTGKELDAETGYGYFGTRYYEPTLLTSWIAVDPMSDKYPSLSPYAYCAWNPVKLVDPNGEDIFIIVQVEQNGHREACRFCYNGKEWNDKDGNILNVDDISQRQRSFVSSLTSAIHDIQKEEDGNNLINYLISYPSKSVEIRETSKENRNLGDGGELIYWNPNHNNFSSPLNEDGSDVCPAFIGLAHELAHTMEAFHYGSKNQNVWFSVNNGDGLINISESEKFAMSIENMVRKEHGLPQRKFYFKNGREEKGNATIH